MKIIQHINGVVVDVLNARPDATAEHVAVVDAIPAYEHVEGYSGVLMYGDGGLYWKQVENTETQELSAEEALNIILGGEDA